MSSKHPIDALFEKELKEHKIEPSAAAWEKVASATQAKGSSKKGIFILRAASVALLVGLSSLFYFNRNTSELQVSTPTLIEESIAAGPDNTPSTKNDEPKAEPSQGTTSPSEPKKEPKKTEKPSTKKRSARVIPVLQQTISDPVLAMNNLEPVSFDLPLEEGEPVEDPNVLRIRLQMPELKGDYSKPKTKKADLGQRMWAYASTQYERVRAGEKVELPNTDDAKIEIPLPDFINRRFNK